MRYFFANVICFAFICAHAYAQIDRPKIQLGDVKLQDFSVSQYPVDSAASAVYLFDGGYSNFVKNNQGYFDIQFTHFARIRVLNKSSFSDIGVLEIPLVIFEENEQKLVKFAAEVYNVENGKILSSYFDNMDLMEDRVLKIRQANITMHKFAFPKIKEGSIIEYSYTIQYPGVAHVHDWDFQKKYPCLWSEYEINQPTYYTYLVTKRGLLHFDIDAIKTTTANYGAKDELGEPYSLSSILSVSTSMTDHVWAMKNIPALKEEPFISSISNYQPAIGFDLYAFQYPDKPIHRIIKTWNDEVSSLRSDDDFGQELNKAGGWIYDALKMAGTGTNTKLEKAKKIYSYVKDNFICDDKTGIYLSGPLKEIYQKKAGSIADINLFLTAMFVRSGFTALPVLLSTRNNGVAPETYPSVENYNYLITLVKIDDQNFLLDASNKFLQFNHLKTGCYNGLARVVDTSYSPIRLSADSLNESSQTTVLIFNEGKALAGSVTAVFGAIQSYRLKQGISKTTQSDFFNKIKKNYTVPVELTDMFLDSLNSTEDPINVRYNINLPFGDEDVIYFNPLLSEAIKENPFKSEGRLYPVEMPFCNDETYVLNMEIPNGYIVDEMPKSAHVNLNEKDGFFEYIINKTNTNIQLKCRLKFNKANFVPDDYQTLRDFYSYVVKKEAEQVVFKKAK